MKNNAKDKLRKLLIWAEESKKVFEKSGETDFRELKRREKKEIYRLFENTGIKLKWDGDSDYTFMMAVIPSEYKIKIVFFSLADYYDDFIDGIYSMYIYIDDALYEDEITDDTICHIDRIMNKKTKIVNLTPHEVTILSQDGVSVLDRIPSSGVARAQQSRNAIGDINGIPVSKTSYGAVDGLPDPEPGKVYIVSVLTAQACPDRTDLYIVDDLVRDDGGNIIGCKSLAQI